MLLSSAFLGMIYFIAARRWRGIFGIMRFRNRGHASVCSRRVTQRQTIEIVFLPVINWVPAFGERRVPQLRLGPKASGTRGMTIYLCH